MKNYVKIRPAKRLSLLLILVLLCAPQRSRAQAAEAYQKANDLMLDEKWGQAETAFSDYIAGYPKSKRIDDARFWMCYAKEQQDPVSEAAFACYKGFVQRYSRSNYADEARANLIGVGQRLAKAGRPGYRSQIERYRRQDNDEVALAALYALRNIGDDEALTAMLDAYDRGGTELRKKIVYMLADFDVPEVTAKLIKIAMNDSSVEVQKSAVYALGNVDRETEVSKALSEILASKANVEVRKAALYAMGNTESNDIIPTLAQTAKSDPNAELAKTAAYALGNIDGEASSKALQSIMLEARSREARKAALYALGNRDGTTALTFLQAAAVNQDDPEIQKAAVYAIGNMDGVKATGALREIFDKAKSREVKKAVLYAMSNQDDEKATRAFFMHTAINSADAEIGKAAVYALSNTLDEEIGPMREIITKAKLGEVRKAALYQVGNEGNEEAVGVLAEMLTSENDPSIRRAVVYALGETESDAAVDALEAVIEGDASTEVKKAAVQALGHIGTPRAKKAILKILGGQQ